MEGENTRKFREALDSLEPDARKEAQRKHELGRECDAARAEWIGSSRY
jgi:hypothetical protein